MFEQNPWTDLEIVPSKISLSLMHHCNECSTPNSCKQSYFRVMMMLTMRMKMATK